eukprot:CAMPEP_0182516702 /NCGR_PEP_ID=MMETSP1321-20130603/40862_1 /TAXON_ID=91990 /ORGANISM="Bolidomonas sp., Strain RCC1657" /LENGTH=595 /DNA_ID=CAMNT_0024724333 /DNA_START=1 /DNA_END=1786 /DNA_ORIENTATION=+
MAAMKKAAKFRPYFMIIFGYFQVVGGLGFLFDIKFPQFFSAFTSLFGGLVSLDFVSFLPMGCLLPYNFYNTLLLYTILPLATSIILISYYLILSRRRDAGSISEANKIIGFFLTQSFIIFPSVSIKVFSTFACRQFDNGWSVIKVDHNLDCNADEHAFYTFYATAMTLVYPIGIPLMYWILLFRKRKLLNGGQKEKEKRMSTEQALREALEEREKNEEKEPTLKSLSFLYGNYEPKYWWFEVFESIRKLALTGFLVFVAPGSAAQVLFSLIICFVALLVYRDCKPFTSESTDGLNSATQLQLYFTLLGALAIKVNLDGEKLQDKGYFDVILTGVQFVPALISFLMSMWKAKQSKDSKTMMKALIVPVIGEYAKDAMEEVKDELAEDLEGLVPEGIELDKFMEAMMKAKGVVTNIAGNIDVSPIVTRVKDKVKGAGRAFGETMKKSLEANAKDPQAAYSAAIKAATEALGDLPTSSSVMERAKKDVKEMGSKETVVKKLEGLKIDVKGQVRNLVHRWVEDNVKPMLKEGIEGAMPEVNWLPMDKLEAMLVEKTVQKITMVTDVVVEMAFEKIEEDLKRGAEEVREATATIAPFPDD